jgi:branched-chain amino acid aminotransferase
MGKSVVYIDGKFFGPEEASVSAFDHGFLYGDGIFEAFRAYGRKIFKFDEHMDRLYDSAKIINLQIPITKEEYKRVVVETVRKSELSDCYIRPQVTRGVGLLGADPGTCKKPMVLVYVIPNPSLKKEKSSRTIISSYRRPPGFSLPPESKMTQYINLILSKMEAKAKGADDAILLDIRGFVSEGCGWNIFLVKNKVVITPSIACSILKGCTRDAVIGISKALELKVEEREITLSELFVADEIFGTGTGTEISPIIEVNGRRVGEGTPGPITNEIERKFSELVLKLGTPIYE